MFLCSHIDSRVAYVLYSSGVNVNGRRLCTREAKRRFKPL